MSDTDMNDLMDMTLDDLEDLPEFAVFPAGAHRALVTLEKKDVGSKPAIEMSMKLVEHLELANPAADEPLPEGSVSNTLFFLDNEFGRGKLKKICAVLGASLGTGNIGEIIEQTVDLDCAVITAVQVDKKDPDKKYCNVKELTVA